MASTEQQQQQQQQQQSEAAPNQSKQNQKAEESSTIRVLPKEVVDRIAAGEVVQRPANALKELLENSLDAGATKIVVHVDKLTTGSASSTATTKRNNNKNKKATTNNNKHKNQRLDFTITDNGKGMSQADLLVAATRFATSKLTSVDDFAHLSSFGFRGEALASISMVSHLTITSRTLSSNVAHTLSYVDGTPLQQRPRKCARTPGTTVTVQDLFYNVPHRQRALNPKEEYPRILALLQPYAVQVAKRGVGLMVQQTQARGSSSTTKTVVDLNTTNLSHVQTVLRQTTPPTSSQPQPQPNNGFLHSSTEAQQAATKQVISTLYGKYLHEHLLYFQSASDSTTATSSSPATPSSSSSSSPQTSQMTYSCEGFLTSPSMAVTDEIVKHKSHHLLLFVNDRCVQCLPLQRQLEQLYATMTPWKKPPFVWLSIAVPADQVDVNVHPTKTHVSLLWLEELVAHLTKSVRDVLAAQGKTFEGGRCGPKMMKGNQKPVVPIENPYKRSKTTQKNNSSKELSNDNDENEDTALSSSQYNSKRKRTSTLLESNDDDSDSDDENQMNDGNDEENTERKAKQQHSAALRPPPPKRLSQGRKNSSTSTQQNSSKNRPQLPSKMVRTHNATPVGALEPFLVRKATPTSAQGNTTMSSTIMTTTTMSTPRSQSQVSPSTQASLTPPPPELELSQLRQTPSSSSSLSMTQASSTQESIATLPLSIRPGRASTSPQQTTSIHRPPCPFATNRSSGTSDIDMSVPGAFAQVSQQCTCRDDDMRQQLSQQQPAADPVVYLPSTQQEQQKGGRRLTPIVPTDCKLDSIRSLRRRIQKRADPDLQQKIRQSYFVGTASEHRSLVQWQEELCLWDHKSLAQTLFYQLALARFGGNHIANLGQRPIRVQRLIEQLLQMEEDDADAKVGLSPCTHKHKSGSLSQVNETNVLLAKQAASCLWDNSAMLEEYFGIRLEQEQTEAAKSPRSELESDTVLLTGLPILLDGHAPLPHGLPLFLLRLATEVNWEEEKPCLDGICRELGYLYAELPASPDAYIQHTLFPALSLLLVPSERLHADVTTLTVLSNLYKVFERC